MDVNVSQGLGEPCRDKDIPCKSTFNCQPRKVDLEEPAQEMQGWRGGLKDAKLLSELLKETQWKELLYPTFLCTTRYYSVLTGTVLYMHVKDKLKTAKFLLLITPHNSATILWNFLL